MLLSTVGDVIVDAHYVGGIFTNCLLLYAIRRFSRQSVGTYKYLLAIFASFDIFLTIIHRLTNPTVVIIYAIFGVVTDTGLENREITGAYCAVFTVPFALMNIHFLYRFWAIRYPEKIILFSNKKFIALISMASPYYSFSIIITLSPLTACFPLWDALIIIVLIRDYREGVISLVRKKKVIDTTTTVWMTVSTVAPPTTVTPSQPEAVSRVE